MFLISSNKLAGAVVLHTICTEDWLLIVWTKWTHLFQITQEFGRNLFQIQNRINIQLRNHLFRYDVFRS